MNNVDQETDNSYAKYALPPEVKEIEAPAPLEFAPWHKPRKQFVRKEQWLKHAISIIEKLKITGQIKAEESLKYLTLPGPDLIDLKLFSEICELHELELQYTGFCYAKDSEAVRLRKNAQRFHLDRNTSIRPESAIHISRLEDITQVKSEARIMMERGGPYRIINIDACEPLANKDRNQTGRLIDAIKTIIAYQLNADRRPWLLYLTTPIQTDSVSAQALDAVYNQVKKNVETDPLFARTLSDRYNPGEDVAGYLRRAGSSNSHEFVRTVTLGISKWFIHLAEPANYGVKQLPCFCYSMVGREPYFPNMIATCYLFEPNEILIHDGTGLTKNKVIEKGTPPKSDHIRALEKSFGIKDLDIMLEQDSDNYSLMVEETKKLLAEVGYDVDHPEKGYDAWLAEQPQPTYEDHNAATGV